MYDKEIEALAVLYEKKDFKNAAKALGIKEASLKNKIVNLEERYSVKILTDDRSEAIFTSAGMSLAEDASFIIRYSNSAVEKAQRIENEEGEMLKIGTSYMAPEKDLTALLEQVKGEIEPLSWKSVHFYSTAETLKHLESHVDMLETFYDERMLKKYGLSAIELRKEKLMLAIREDSDLSSIPLIDIEDLYGRRVYIYRKGYLKAFDQLRADIADYHKEIEIVSFDSYTEELEKRIEKEDSFLVTLKSLEPGMTGLRVKSVLWNYSAQFGILYKKDPCDKVKKAADAIRKAIKSNLEKNNE